jgi:hypothetical protein
MIFKKFKSVFTTSDPKSLIENISNNDVLVIAFGGIMAKMGFDMPPFEFVNTLSKKGVDVLFLRDLKQAWYQIGLNGIGTSITEISKFLNEKAQNYDFVILMGTSMGGYASLLFSQLINADISIAFAPQTFIDPVNRKKLHDDRWNKQMNKFHKLSKFSTFYDLKEFFKNQKTIKTESYVFYGSEDKLDSLHAVRMNNLNSFHIFEVKNSPHNSAQKLKDEGIIDNVLDFLISNKTSKIPSDYFPEKFLKPIIHTKP